MADEKQPSVTVNCVEPHQTDDHAAQAVTPQKWPTEPGLLVADHHYDILMNVYDGFLCAIPLFLMAKTSLCIYAHNLDKENRGDYIDRVSHLTTFLLKFNEQLVTAFTIVFITIMTTVVRRLALYKAQEGATVSDLEQLQASISLPSTIKMVFSLRKFTKFSTALIVVWSFYYLGSQSSKREYGYVLSSPYHHIRGAYPTDDAADLVVFSSNSSDIDYLNQQLRASDDYTLSMNAIKGIDSNGYVLVPCIDPLQYSKAIEDSLWIEFQPSEVTYSAVVGRALSIEPQAFSLDPTEWMDSKVVGDYTFNTTYMDVRCESVDIYPESAFPANVTPGMWTSINKTSPGSSSLSLIKIDVWGRWNESYWSLPNGSYPALAGGDQLPLTINGSTSGSVKFTCNATYPAVRVRVHCSEIACLAKAIQYLPLDTTRQFVNPLADDDFAAAFFSNLLHSYGPPDGVYGSSVGTVIEKSTNIYLTLLDISTGKFDLTNLTDFTNTLNYLDIFFLNSALTKYMNSYYNLAMPSMAFESNPGPDKGFELVSIKGSLYDPHYALFWPWIAISYTSASILLAAATFSFWLRRRTLAPDIFGYISSLTRDDPHLLVTSAGSTMSGIERARYLQDVNIRIGDVYGQSGEIGKVGVTVVHHAEAVHPLRKGRKYF